MCYGCWEEYGAQVIDTPAVREAAALISKVYEFSIVGGGLHVVVDDFNIEDEHLAARYAREDDPPEQIAAEDACLVALRALTLNERASALALHDGFWRRPENPNG